MPLSEKAKLLGNASVQNVYIPEREGGGRYTPSEIVGMTVRTFIAKELLAKIIAMPSMSHDEFEHGPVGFAVRITDALLEELAK